MDVLSDSGLGALMRCSGPGADPLGTATVAGAAARGAGAAVLLTGLGSAVFEEEDLLLLLEDVLLLLLEDFTTSPDTAQHKRFVY